FRTELQLAAEAAAHVLTDDPDVGLGNVQARREVVARRVDALCRDPRRQLVAVPLAHRAVRLHADVRDDVRRVGLFQREGRGLESGLEIAVLRRLPRTDIARRKHFGRPAGQRGIDADDRGHRLVLHLPRARGVDGVFFGVRDDSRDFVALVHDDRRLWILQIAVNQRRLEAGHALGRREIDRHDAGVRVRRADDARVEHARTRDVEGVLRASADLVGAVEALDARADDGLRRGRPVVLRIDGRLLRCAAAPGAALRRLALVNRGASPLGLPYTLSRAPLRRRAPFAWLTRYRSFARASHAAPPCPDPHRSPTRRPVRPSTRFEYRGRSGLPPLRTHART